MLPTLRFPSPLVGWLTLGVWVCVQAIWLQQAYLLEFTAKDNFVDVWAAGLLYVAGHAWVLERLLDAWSRGRKSIASAGDSPQHETKVTEVLKSDSSAETPAPASDANER